MRFFYLHILFALACCLTGFAQTIETDSSKNFELDDVVITAGKFNSSPRDIHTRINLISSKEIEASPGTRVPDILKFSSSVYIKSYGLSPFLQTISMNGLGPEHTLILIDGVKLNSFQNGQIDLSLLSGDNIQKIEIMNGGGSSVYGSEAIGGVINIITGSPAFNGKDFAAAVSASNGSFNTHRYSASVSGQTGSLGTRLYYSIEESDGNFDYNFINGDNTERRKRKNAAYNIYDVGINSSFITDTTFLIKYISTFSFQDKQVPGIEAGSSSAHTLQKDKNWNNILVSEKIFSSSVSIHSALNFQNNYMHYTTSETQKSFYKNLVYAATSDLKWNNGNINVITGYSFTHASLNSNETQEGIHRNQHALYFSSELPLTSELKLFPSARYDYISDIKRNVLSYKAGINYQPFQNIDLAFKANAGKNFRAPAFNDIYWKEWGNPYVKPEYSFNIETGLYYSFYKPAEATVELSFNYIDAKDKIVWMPQRNLTWKPFNIDKTVSNNASLTFSLRKNITEKLTLKINSGYTITEARKKSETYKGDPTFNKFTPYLPLQSARLSLITEYESITLSLLYTYTGKRFSDFENKNTVKGFNLLDGTLSFVFSLYELTTKLKLAVNNITNIDYQTISGYPMPLRYYNLTLSVNY